MGTGKRRKSYYVAFVLDRSGSMHAQVDDAIGGFNSFLEEQRKLPGKCTIQLTLFDHEQIVYAPVPVATFAPLTKGTYVPRGQTALLDAVGAAIARAEGEYGKKIVAVLTDGYENSSKEWTSARLGARIAELKKKGWDFVFIGAGLSKWGTAMQSVMDAAHIDKDKQFVSKKVSSKDGTRSFSSYVGMTRTSGEAPKDKSWQVTDEEA